MATEYYLFMDVTECNIDIKVNDIPLFKDQGGGSIGTRFGINHIVRSGQNNFSVALLPMDIKEGFGIRSACTIKVFSKIAGADDADNKLLCQGSFEYDEKKIVTAHNLNNQFVITFPDFEPSPWEKNEALKLDKKLQQQILDKYNSIISLFARKKVAEVMKETDVKNNYIIGRYNQDKAERLKFIENYYQAILNGANWNLAYTDPNTWILREYAQKKLFCFELPNGDPPIHFQSIDKQLNAFIPVYLYYDGKNFVWVF